MRIVCISDTHNRIGSFDIPDGDVLIHAGDLTMNGRPEEIVAQFALLSAQPHDHIIFTPGNHDWGFQTQPELRQALGARFPRVTVLIDEMITIGGLRLYASPYQPNFNDWAFQFAAGPVGIEQARAKWKQIPDDTQILITHGPPYGTLDRTLHEHHVGCSALKSRIEQLLDIRLHVFGHVHESYGSQRVGNTLFVNASTCDAKYKPTQTPIIVDFAIDSSPLIPSS